MNITKSLKKLDEQWVDIKKELAGLGKVASVSLPSHPRKPLEEAAKKVQQLLQRGTPLKNVRRIRFQNAPPYVFGETKRNPNLPTVLLYAHYDVQPVAGEALWKSPPFEPKVRRGRMYGRGIADDKAGVMVHVATLRSLASAKDLPFNVKVLIEGEEEIGSPHLKAFLREHKNLLQSDIVLVVDTANYDTGIGTLTTSLRGMVHLSVSVHSMKAPLHSGLWGGAVPDPTMALYKAFSGLVDDNGQSNVKGLLKRSAPPATLERKLFSSLAVGKDQLRKQTGLLEGVRLLGGAGRPSQSLRRTWLETSIAVNAANTGDGETAGNTIANRASARLGVRFAFPQKAQEVQKLVLSQLRNTTPWGVRLEAKELATAEPWRANVQGKFFNDMLQALEQAYGQGKTALAGSGASIPFVPTIQDAFKNASVFLLGIEDPYTNAHGENESLHLGDFEKTTQAQLHFLHRLR